ncbi:hypothetical protein OQA88_417 [Cercophora sp. LCS_1]
MALFQHLAAPTPLSRTKALLSLLWSHPSRRLRLTVLIIFVLVTLHLLTPSSLPIPSLSLEYHYAAQSTKFNASKVALLIENRPNPILAPLMLHFISVVPPDWRFRFMGSIESVTLINSSVAIREQVAAGKLDLSYIPANMTTGSQEEISRFLTNLWLYETYLAPAEWLLVFQTDSMLCANSRKNLNDYLDYDWVGAPWNPNSRFGGNGGLSMRRVSAIVKVLKNQIRVDGSDPEDVWLTDRLGHLPGGRLANGSVSIVFSGESKQGEKVKLVHASEVGHGGRNGTKHNNQTALLEAARNGSYVEGLDDWREGFYEPMGYHTGGSGVILPSEIWGTTRLRKHIWDYCPEIKMTLDMDSAQYITGNCAGNWKRDDASGMGFIGIETEEEVGDEGDGLRRRGYETEMIDGVEYPLLPNLMTFL